MNNNPPQDNEIDIRFLLSFLVRHKKLIFLVSIISILTSFYYTITVPPTYDSSTSLMVKNSDSGDSNILYDIIGSRKTIEIENEKLLIKSRIVSENVIKELWRSDRKNNLNILGTRKYIPRGQKVRRFLRNLFSLGFYQEIQSEEQILDSTYTDKIIRFHAERLQKNIGVYNKQDTDILVISYSSQFADEAELISNQIAESYIKMDRELSLNQAYSILSFVEYQSNEIENDLFVAEEKLTAFKENKGIFDLSGNSELILTQLIDSESKYYNTLAELSISKERHKFLSGTLSHEEKTFANNLLNSINPKLLALRTKISQKEIELLRNEGLHGKEHLTVIKLINEIATLKKNLDDQAASLIKQGIVVADPVEYRQELIKNLLVNESQIADLEVQGNQYKKLVDKFNNELIALPSLQLGYARLERDRAVLNSTYMLMRQKLEESRIQVASVTGKVQTIDKAVEPLFRTSPKHKKNLLFGLVIGMMIGIGIAGIIEFFDYTIKSLDDISESTTILGIIPSINTNKNNKKRDFLLLRYFKNRFIYYYKIFFRISPKLNSNTHRHLITHEDPRSPVSEAYRSLRSSIIYNINNKNSNNAIIVSSTGPGEGKTTTISNLAITYANLGKKVLLVDTDLRKPVIHKVFKLLNKDGITKFLMGQEKDYFKLIQKTKIENLNIITSGIIPPNPSELLGSNEMKIFYEKVKEDWDFIFFDSPPLVAVTDASIISDIINNLILVVMPGKTDKRAFRHCLKNLSNINIPPLGIVFNGVESKNSYGSYYYYYQAYDYYGTDK